MSQTASTRNINEIDRKLKYLDMRDKIMKTIFKKAQNLKPVLPNIEKEKALKALEWDGVFYNSKQENQVNFDKSKSYFCIC